jgi:prepilin-type N-terminal cleavage/methylation domain-containing protein
MRSSNMNTKIQGFTLVEIMIVVGIIGMLAAIAIPAFQRARLDSQVSAIANDLRVFDGAFQMYAMEHGGFPGEMEGPHFMPPNTGINSYLEPGAFTNPAVISGSYDWDGPPAHLYYGISVRPAQVSTEIIRRLDRLMDDDNPLTGQMLWMYGGNRYVYTVQ